MGHTYWKDWGAFFRVPMGQRISVGGGEFSIWSLVLGLLTLVVSLEKIPQKLGFPLGFSLIEGNFTRFRPFADGVTTKVLTGFLLLPPCLPPK